MNDTVIEYIDTKGWEFKESNGQYVLRECPLCHDEKSHFYISPEGPWFCHKCREKGNLWTLKKRMGDIGEQIRPAFKKPEYKRPEKNHAEKFHQTLLKDPGGLAYLEGRGITMESIKRFKLGLSQQNSTRWLAIPHLVDGETVNIKFRSLPPAAKAFKRIPGCRSVLFNSDAIKGRREIIITEGELDAITLLQAGMENVVGATNGANAFDPEWIDQLKDVKKIVICYDSDEAGQSGARNLAKRLGYNRCFNVELDPGMDANDFFRKYDSVDFRVMVECARKFDLPGVISTDAAIDLLIREKNDSGRNAGLMTPWENINRLVKGFKPGDLIILSAPPKTGKTSFAENICLNLAFQEIPVFFYCLEMRAEHLVKKAIQWRYRKDEVTEEDLMSASREFAGLPLYFAHSFKKQKLEDVLSLIREGIKRYDFRLVVFDNLHFLIRSVSNVNEELGQAVQGFKLLAEEMEIPVVAIAQPRKREASERDEIMRADDIKYSNAVHADCDQMIILYRKRIATKAKELDGSAVVLKDGALDPVTLIRVEAHRYGPGGEALLYFHGEYSRFDVLGSN